MSKVGTVHFLDDLKMIPDKFFPIGFHGFGVESGDFDHDGTLYKNKPSTKDIRLVNVMLSKARTTINNMGFPQDGRKILRGASDSGHGKSLTILISRIIKVILTLPKIDEFKLTFFCDKNISRLNITMTDTLTLKE